MRWVIYAVFALALAPSAFAGDLDVLPGLQAVGPPTFTRWSGFYFGGQAAYSGGNADFSGSTQAPLAYALRETELEEVWSPSQWPLLGSATARTTSYGAFVGYNTQWQEIVLGGEVDYSRANMGFTAPSTPIARTVTTVDSTTQAETAYDLSAIGSATLHLVDYASLRARAGWIVGDNFLPYGFGGFAVGRGDYTQSSWIGGPTATTGPTESSPTVPAPVLADCPNSGGVVPETCSSFSVSSNSGGHTTFLYGYNVGGGVDIALTSNIFLRGEFEYVHFLPLNGIVLDIAAARIGAGLKF